MKLRKKSKKIVKKRKREKIKENKKIAKLENQK